MNDKTITIISIIILIFISGYTLHTLLESDRQWGEEHPFQRYNEVDGFRQRNTFSDIIIRNVNDMNASPIQNYIAIALFIMAVIFLIYVTIKYKFYSAIVLMGVLIIQAIMQLMFRKK